MKKKAVKVTIAFQSQPYELAIKVCRRYDKQLRKLKEKMLSGDKDAACELIRVMNEQEIHLSLCGYVFNETGKRPKLIRTPPEKIVTLKWTDVEKIIDALEKRRK